MRTRKRSSENDGLSGRRSIVFTYVSLKIVYRLCNSRSLSTLYLVNRSMSVRPARTLPPKSIITGMSAEAPEVMLPHE